MWTAAGIAASIALAVFAWRRSFARQANYYAEEIYGMTPLAHRRYAVTGIVLAMLFAVAYGVPLPVVPLLAVLAVVWILYAASFVRGFSGEDEGR